MDAHQNGFIRRDIAHDQGDVVFICVDVAHVSVDVEFTVFGRKFGFAFAFVELFGLFPVSDQVRDRADLQVVLFGENDQFVRAHHRAVIGHDFAAETRRLQSGQARQVDSRFGVAVAHEHAIVHCFQREDMAGSAEIFGFGVVLHGFHDR